MNMYTNKDVINFTSVDDIHSSIALMGNGTIESINDEIEYLRRSLEFEPKHLNRISVIKMLEGKIKRLKKSLG